LKYQVLLYIFKYISQYKTNCIPKLLIVEELGSNIRSINRILKQLAEEGMIVNLNGKIQVDDLNLILAMISDYDL
ncbi:MAG: Crp/Fnr family transcriptional regulator, partial [Turicibacter sp.]|nr:Crp/Fnr family transcriptional regulator [Turicibacter sp.]